MRTPNTSKSAPVAAPQGPQRRFEDVRTYMIDRGVDTYTAVFTAIDPSLDEHVLDIRQWWNSRKRCAEGDIPVIEKLERVVDVLKANASDQVRA